MKQFLVYLCLIVMLVISNNSVLIAHNDSHELAIDSNYNFIVPPRISFDVQLADSSGPLNGNYFVTIRIGSEAKIDKNTYDMVPFRWIRSFSNVNFQNGVASFVLGDNSNPITPNDLSDSDTVIQIEVNQLTAAFPLPSVPYSIYSQSSLHAEEIKAENIIGSFITTMNISHDFIVSKNGNIAVYIDSDTQSVGVRKKPNSAYAMDVDGIVNATEYLIKGEPINNIFSWTKNSKGDLYHEGNVGIHTKDPQYALHVSGNISAREYYVVTKDDAGKEKSEKLENYLAAQGLNWKSEDNTLGIYYIAGNVGIGTSENIVESLVVSGAVKLSESIQSRTNIKPGTIEYRENDFFAYLADGSSSYPVSLTGIKIDPNSVNLNSIPRGSIPYFVADGFLDVTDNFKVVTRNNFFGIAIGTDNATAALTVQGNGQDSYLEVLSEQNEPVFIVNKDGNISVGTTNINENIKFKIDGIVDATEFLKNGNPLASSLSENSFWNIGETHYGELNQAATDLFYSAGFVGIGTASPKNMLELSSSTDSVALTFDINDVDLFTIGITSENASTFVISQGSNLDLPIFSFSTKNIGVGLSEPKVSLHVSGNAGFLVEGETDLTYSLNQDFPEPVTGSAMFYYPVRAAFRAGYASDLEWSDANLGAYSAAFGYNNIASGLAAFVGGGYENVASGDYSVVPGGIVNKAMGDYSFAGGYYASALHKGSFVWADTTSSLNRFESVQNNQFLIRAYGGVGINTNQTSESALTVQHQGSGDILRLIGSGASDQTIGVSSKGQFYMGDQPSPSHDDAKLLVSGRVGVGTDDPKALFHIENMDDEQAYLMYIKGSSSANASSNVFVITNTGNVGIGTEHPTVKLAVSGNVKADSFLMVDPDDPTAVIQLQPSNGSPFQIDSGLGRLDAYRLQGFIGLGTMTPNTLLELSNQNDVQALPIITFDYNDVDIVQMGLITSNEGVFFAIAPSSNFVSENATFVITGNSVILGRGVVPPNPNFALDVSGNLNIDGKLAVGTDNVLNDYDVFVNGSLAVSTLNIGGSDFELPEDNLWEVNGVNLYASDNYTVLIGTDNASQSLTDALVVSGSVRVDNLIISANQFKLDGELAVDHVRFQDQLITTQSASVFVEGGELVFEKWNGTKKSLSSPLQAIEGDSNQSGPLAFWVDDNTISKSPFYWNGTKKELAITSNVFISNYDVQANGLEVSTNVSFLDDIGFAIETTIDHKGDANSSTDYTLYDLDLNIEEDWGRQGTSVAIKGIDLNLRNNENTLILNNASVTGIYVDVTSVNVSESQFGNKYAAKFLGGNVGIGVEDPSVALEVNGVISANYFNITSGISIPELVINEAVYALVVKKSGTEPRVGIGTESPQTSLDVVGTVSANLLTVSGLLVSTMNIGDGSFVVDATGNIGIGTDFPEASFEINRVLDGSNQNSPYIAEKISLGIDGTTLVGQTYVFQQDLTGLYLDLDTMTNSSIQDAEIRGLDLDLVSVNLRGDSKLYGMYVDVGAPQNENENRYAAVFLHGNVGIGTTNPTAELVVSGSIKADTLILSEGLEFQTGITVNNSLVVEGVASMNRVSINRLYVEDSFSALTLSFDNTDIQADNATFGTITVNQILDVSYASIDTVSANNIEVSKAIFTNALSVATDNIEPNTLKVDGTIKAISAIFTDTVTVPTLSVENSGTTLFAGNKKVGIGTDTPESALHIISSPDSPFDQANTETWNALKMGVDRDISGQTVGFLFSPDKQVSQNIGSGILAQRTEFGQSSLLFLTDPPNESPKVRMIISDEGTVGIGDISNPLTFSQKDSSNQPVTLYVDGTAKFTDDVTMDRLELSQITGKQNSLIISANNGIGFRGDVSFNNRVQLDKALAFKSSRSLQIQPTEVPNSVGYLYVYNNDLFYVNQSTSKNISSVYSGVTGQVPVFDDEGTLKSTYPLSFNDNIFTIGTSNSYTQLKLESVVSSDASVGVQEIIVTFDRQTGSNTRFVAFDIQMEGDDTSDSLGINDTAIGLNIDVSRLSGQSANDNKYAAIFNGGNVGVGISDPGALLHVKQAESKNIFRVDGDNFISLMVSSTGNVGVGTATPLALFEIEKPNNYLDDLFKIVSGNETLLRVSSNGSLVIKGDVSANIGVFNVVSANALSIADGMFFVSSNGDVAIGTDNFELGTVAIYKEIDNTQTTAYIGEKLDVVIDFEGDDDLTGSNSNWDADYTYNKDLTGFDISLSNANGNQFGDSSIKKMAKGINVAMNNLDLGPTAMAYGLYVDVGNEDKGGTRYGAYFNGNVGIGTKTPTYSLTVSGNVYSSGLIVDGNVSANQLTVNNIIVNGLLDVAGDVTINGTLTATKITANTLIVDGAVQAGEGIYKTVTVNQRLFLPQSSQLIVGMEDGFSDSNYIMYVSGNVTFNGIVDVDKLNVSVISANNTTINISSVISANKMISGESISLNMLQFSNSVNPNVANSLFVEGDNLFFNNGGVTRIDLTSFLTSDYDNRIPVYYGSTLTSNVYALEFNADTLVFGGDLGTGYKNLGLEIGGQVTKNFTGHLVSVNVKNVTAGSQNFTGVKINFKSENYPQGNVNSWGRLSEGDSAVGLHVDLQQLLGDYYGLGGNVLAPKKYAALFNGGLVGIGTDTPQAALHVKQYENYFNIRKDIFRVDTFGSTTPAFLVDKDGRVGINSLMDNDAITAQFVIEADSTINPFVVSSNSKVQFAVQTNGVGIQTETLGGATLAVAGNMLVSDSLGNDQFFVSDDGVAIGHTIPTADLDIMGDGSKALLRISDGVDDHVYVDKNGKFYMGTFNSSDVQGTPLYDFNIINPTSSIALISNNNNPFGTIALPTKLTAPGNNPYGVLAVNGSNSNLLFMGHVTANESLVLFGGSNSPQLNIVASTDTKEKLIMDVTKQGLGINRSVRSNTALAVSGNFFLGDDVDDAAFFVDSDSNFVGVNTKDQSASEVMRVDGSLLVDELEVAEGGITITTLNVNGQFVLNDTLNGGSSGITDLYESVSLNINLNTDMNNKLYGLKIDMNSNLSPESDEDPYYLMAGNADAYGIHVDMSDLNVANGSSGTYYEDFFGNKYAAVFMGGAVGIGTEAPRYPLEVVGEPNSVIAGFGSIGSGMVIRDYGLGKLGINVINDSVNSSLEHVGITIKASETNGSGYTPALVGIGTLNPDKALVVNGDMRLGVRSLNPVAGLFGRYGNKLFFSGGPSHGLDSDNGDDLFIARYNVENKSSHLRVNFSTINSDSNDEAGVANGSDQFVVGYTKSSGLYQPVLKVHNNSRVTVWGDTTLTTQAQDYLPDSTLHVRGSGSTNDSVFGDYTATLERSGGVDSGVLALSYDTSESLSDKSKFIGFYSAQTLIGSIEGNSNGGIRFVTSGADYAEYLKKKDSMELFEKGDIVAVVNGVISKDTSDFQQLMVLSSAAAIAGNWPQGNKDDFELVAFYGQVPTKVKGRVRKGDFILAGSGNDGIGIAKSQDSLSTQDRSRIVGRAWESSNDRGVKLINTAVGFSFGNYSLNDEMAQLNNLNKKLDGLRSERNDLLSTYQTTLEKQSQHIETLLMKLENSR